MLTCVFNLKTYICFRMVLMHLVKVSAFPSFDLCMFTAEDGTTINNEW